MSFWFPEPVLVAQEKVDYRTPGGLFVKRRLVIGRITVTDQRFIFIPNWLDSRVGVQPLEFPRADIRALRIALPGRGPAVDRGAGAGRRPQVEIDRPADVMSVVTVKDPEALIKVLHPDGI